MITSLHIDLDLATINELLRYFNSTLNFSADFERSKITINQPTGDFFYDPWKIKPEFENSIYKTVLDSLKVDIGESRFIVMKPGTCYHSHADIDDRYHLNIQGQYSYLIDLDTQQMHETLQDGKWYNMNASYRHTAANFGSTDRIQLVVRQLLQRNKLKNPVEVNLRIGSDVLTPRFAFDDTVSNWMNMAVKRGILDNFKTDLSQVWFNIEEENFEELNQLVYKGFVVTIAPSRDCYAK